jgi:cytochrome c-type biogenesis protein CcmH/NrfG
MDTRREGSMAARLLLLVVVMLGFAALYGCAQEAAKDRQPMKRVKEPTTAEIAPHEPEESDHHVRRAKAQ